MPKETIKYFEFEIPILEGLMHSLGEAKISQVYTWIRKNKADIFDKHPEILGRYKKGKGDIVWKNKIRWAREYMKKKGQLEFPERGVWKLTRAGFERFKTWQKTGKDPDAGLETVFQIPEEKMGEPERAFKTLEHIHGNVLGIKNIPIVYEPINEQGVILLFTALAAKLGFLILSIRPQFPDAKLAKRGIDSRYKDVRAEFEFRSLQFKVHGHDHRQCDLIICWEHDWEEAPIKVLELKNILGKI